MKFGVKLGNLDRLPLDQGVGRMAVVAEELGFDSVFVADHVVFPREYALDEEHKLNHDLANGQHGEALISLAYVAGLTKRILLGTSVMVMPLRNPLLTAKMLATLDVLSAGRVMIGVGVGWLASEFAALDAPAFGSRGQVTEEWIRIFRTCWKEQAPSLDGRYYQFPPLHFEPKPSRPIPILIGGNSAAALRRAGTIGDGWHGTRVEIAELPSLVAKVKAAAAAAGRDPAGLTFALGVELDILDRDPPSVAGMVAPAKALAGTSDQIIERIAAIRTAGIDHLELRFRPMRDISIKSIDPTLRMMERFSKEIMPHFAAA